MDDDVFDITHSRGLGDGGEFDELRAGAHDADELHADGLPMTRIGQSNK